MTTETMTAHSFDPTTLEYLLPVRIYSDKDGNWLLPENTVTAQPRSLPGELEALVWSRADDTWAVVPDYRRLMLWDTASGRAVPNTLSLGERPNEGTTIGAPIYVRQGTPQRNAWDAVNGTWQLVPDFSGTPVYEKTNGELAASIAPGLPLPANLTTISPPKTHIGPWRFDDPTEQWALEPVAPVVEPPTEDGQPPE